jgi:hypothetical protein
MSVTPMDVIVYGCANMPEADGATVGGAVDFSKRIAFNDISPNGTMDVVSSASADTATKITYAGRDATGAIQQETLTISGQTAVTGTKTLERLLYGALSGAGSGGPLANPGGTAATGDVALLSHAAVISAHTAQAGSANHSGATPALMKLAAGDGASVAIGQIVRTTGGTGPNQLRMVIAASGFGADVVAVNRDWATIPDATTTYNIHQGLYFDSAPNVVTQVIRAFATAAADVPGGASRDYYEKLFVANNNTATALTGATIAIQSETPALPSGAAINLALTTALNDAATVTNRQTAPATGITAFTSSAPPQSLNVPNPGNLPPGAVPNAAGAQGVWLNLHLPAGTAAYKGALDLRTQGATI